MTENNQTPFIEDNDQTRARREHLERIQQLTGNAYPNKFRRTNLTTSAEGEDTITSVVAQFKHHEPPRAEGQRPTPEQLEAANAALKAFGDVRVSGRLAVPPRVMGKAAFVHLSDGRERLQIYVRRDDVQQLNHRGRTLDGWELFSLLDHGDFIGVEGFLFVTKTGELSVHVREFEFLAKALLPMPDKMHGISDPEIRQRQRYADLIAGSLKIDRDEEGGAGQAHELTTREVFERRSKIIREMRAFLDERGYIEVETPMLTPIASGAAARPFKTHHNALDIDLYARIAPELYLKRLVVGGFERVYELNRNFRNEGISTRHNPEFTMLEFYCAYMDVNGMMDLCEEMIKRVVNTVCGGLQVQFNGRSIDFNNFKRLTMKQAIVSCLTIENSENPLTAEMLNDPAVVYGLEKRLLELEGEPYPLDIEQEGGSVNDQIRGRLNLINFNELAKTTISSPQLPDPEEIGRKIEFLFERIVEGYFIGRLEQPVFITDFPKPVSPLSKASPDDPSVAERFELYIAGMECANGFSELNDPVEQYERFREQGQARERGDEEAMQMDTDYVRALAYGMPPAAGIGIGIDRIVMLLTNRRSIRDVILFPHMRPAAPKVEEAAANETAESANEQAGGQGA
ncbi:MAG: lysyl-tRNA synthetase, class [Pyrinomonadaceae bacterium]|jgi:lysyl-tRNA synthetase class 2|nr:lysyl-tRNA synthetase, class [Pyrinomonadaceae bacterium]